MGILFRSFISILILGAPFALMSCSTNVEKAQNAEPPAAIVSATANSQPSPSPSPLIPNLQTEILDERDKTSDSPIGNFDFKNFTFPLPRGWQNPDGSTDITLTNGRLSAVPGTTTDNMSDEQRAEEKSKRRIGMSFVTTKFLDVTGDGEDEAVVVLKIETGGGAIPQVVYVYKWEPGQPELIWSFRTGDRADGGLKDIRVDAGELVVELFGQDRFILGQIETSKITGDEEQLCCPTFFTRTVYRWNGSNFLMQRKRLTFSVADPNAAPVENLGDKVNAKPKSIQ